MAGSLVNSTTEFCSHTCNDNTMSIDKSDIQTVPLTVSNDYGTMKTIMAGLHLTSRRPCWLKRTKAFLSAGN